MPSEPEGATPPLIVTLTGKLAERVREEAQQQQRTPDQLIQAILRDQLPPCETTEVDPLPLWRRSTKELIKLLESDDPLERGRVRGYLSTRGSEAFDDLEIALSHANPVVSLTAAELLAKADTILALRPLLIAYAGAELPFKRVLDREVQGLMAHYETLPNSAWSAIRLCTPRTAPLVSRQIKITLNLHLSPKDRIDPSAFGEGATVAEIASLTALLRWQRTGDVARQAAAALNQIALSAPVPQLREALPLLHPAWHIRLTHPELVEALRTIEAATALWKDLPILSRSGDDAFGQDLPMPVDNSP